MKFLTIFRIILFLTLVASPALAREMEEKLTIRTLKVWQHPGQASESIYVSAQVMTGLRFEAEVDTAKTKFLFEWEGRFEPLLAGGNKVVLEPLRQLNNGEALPLLVTLVDGTAFTFLVKPKLPEDGGWVDYQVNVFKDPDSYNSLLSRLYDSLNRERSLRDENERFKKEESSVDHAYATLLANGEVKKTPFRRKKVSRMAGEGLEIQVEMFQGPGKGAVVVHLKNKSFSGPWGLDGAYVNSDFSSFTSLPFALRMSRPKIEPGQSGTIAVVVDRSAFETEGGQLTELALQLFREDGFLQLAARLPRSLLIQ